MVDLDAELYVKIFGLAVNFPFILTLLVVLSGLIVILDKFIWSKSRQHNSDGTVKRPAMIEHAYSLFPIFLLVLFLRSFLVEPFRIPSGSMEPMLLPGDFILVNKYQYGLRLPVSETVIWPVKKPKLGEVVVFRWPPDDMTYFIKRVVGLPGDHIQYKDKVLYINEQPMDQIAAEYKMNLDGHKVQQYAEQIGDLMHDIYRRPDVPAKDFDYIIPPEHYFMMGDNRDDSSDSRYWGLVPYQNLVGQAFRILFSWDSVKYTLRWQRTIQKIS